MRPTGHRWRKLKARFKADCRNRRAPCWCGGPIDYDAPAQSPYGFEADHYHPVATHPHLMYAYSNLRPSHCKCNRARRDAAPDERPWVKPDW